MKKSVIKKYLSKYFDNEKLLVEALKHITYYSEHIDSGIKNIGDCLDLDISIDYTCDGIDYNLDFIADHSGNGCSWFCEDFDDSDETTFNHTFYEAVCNFLNETYPYARL